MAGRESESEKEEEWPVAGARLLDSPILFFVASHKAFRAELASIHRAAAEAAASAPAARREIAAALGRRLEFLRLVYNYHSAAEDEVIFLALDALVKNVVPAYALEHKSIDDKFSSIFHHLDLLLKKDADADDAPLMFRELLFSIGTIRTMICQHMHKEEEQVFPSLLQKLTSAEQSKLVWQCVCSVPMMLLEEFLPWMTLRITSEEKRDVLDCVELIIPKDRKLQEVVTTLIIQHEERSCETDNKNGKVCRLLNGLSRFKDIRKLYPSQTSSEQEELLKKAGPVQMSGAETPIKGIYLWHAALRRGFDQVIEELYQIRSSSCSSSLSSVIFQIKFITDVLIFYSNSLEKIVHQLLSVLAKNTPSLCSPLIDESHIKSIQRLLFYERQGSAQLRSFAEMLCQEMETLVKGLGKNLVFLETEVLPSISEICTSEMQLWLMYTTLQMMPLGLLRCTVTWFSSNLSDDQSNSVLENIKLGCPSVNESFTSLLHEWVRISSSGKISIDKFREDLEEMFNGRSSYLVEQNGENIVSSGQLLNTNSVIMMKKSVATTSSSDSTPKEKYDISYPCEMNLHKFFSLMLKRKSPLQKNFTESDPDAFLDLEPRPMDIVYYIHRALIKDMEYLVSLSTKLVQNFEFLAEFKNRFELISKFYQCHSNSEDEIAFPALESKGALQNISQSYCIDHQLEIIHFRKISVILNHISEFHDRPKHYQLCLRLHDTCLSMHQVLSDHIHREDVEIFPLFRTYFSTKEEEKIVGHMLGVMGAEILQEMIPWLMAYLNLKEQNTVISLWLKVTRYTNFDEWLREWWEGMKRYDLNETEEVSIPSPSLAAADPLEVVSRYLSKESTQAQKGDQDRWTQKKINFSDLKLSGSCNVNESTLVHGGQDLSQNQFQVDKKRLSEVDEGCQNCRELSHQEHPLSMDQEDLEAMIRRVSRDSNLDLQEKSYIIQNLLMSRWTITQKMSQEETSVAIPKDQIPGQSPSYQDPLKLAFGCEHYKRNCKLLAPCCNKLYTCIRCHDDLTDHSVDRKAITAMMCMKCLMVQPIGSQCINDSCNGFSMGRYYCRICKLFDDGRQIYHCPYCNLCRVGKGLGIDYFHCMKCNACMSTSLYVHVCREKCLEDNCPICHEYIFTSNSPVKGLPCGHLMHSSCYKDYTFSHYICPICSKSLGDMQLYFGMLDALLAEERTPEEYAGKTQVILCNDCEKRGNASFHWLYHKCPHCGSFNTRLI